MKRCIILMMDSFGIGAASDAAAFGDSGADTLGHIVEWYGKHCPSIPFHLPHLTSIGLVNAHTLSTGHPLPYSIGTGPIKGAYTYAKEISRGKDTLSGHWELTGVPVDFDWGYFPDVPHCFPKDIVDGLITGGNLPGVLGEKHASGTEIIKELGCEHMRTGKPIIYTSADSVLQIAAHEETWPRTALYPL